MLFHLDLLSRLELLSSLSQGGYVKSFRLIITALALLVLVAMEVSAMPGNPIRVFFLDNGLQVIMKEQHEKNLIAVNAYVKGGSRTETPDIS